MTLVTEETFNACDGGAVVTMTYDDETGEIDTVAWDVRAGVLRIPEPCIEAIAGDTGSITLTAADRNPGPRMVRHPKGGWFYDASDGRGISWGDAPHLGAGRWREIDPQVRREQAAALLETMRVKS